MNKVILIGRIVRDQRFVHLKIRKRPLSQNIRLLLREGLRRTANSQRISLTALRSARMLNLLKSGSGKA